MQANLVGWILTLGAIVLLALLLRRVFTMHRRGLAQGRESLDHIEKSIAIAEENLALNKERIAQGEETIALLKAINRNLENRTIKN